MGNGLMIFENEKFGEIRTIEDNNKVLFCGSDIAKALGYAKPANAVSTHCKSVALKQGNDKLGRPQMMSFIPEGDVYRLITNSKLPSAQEFESWVFDEVLPSIRKHGLYAIDELIDNPDLLIKAMTALKEERDKNKQLTSVIEEQKPLVDFAKHVTDSADSIDIGELSKVIANENIKIGRNRLFEFLRGKKILMSNNEPYQRYVENGWMKTIEIVKQTTYGTKVFIKTLVNGKGQVGIVEMLRKEVA